MNTTTSMQYPNTVALAQGSHTHLAELLNAAMEANWGARHLYLATYGEPWRPLPLNGNPGTAQPQLDDAGLYRAQLATAVL